MVRLPDDVCKDPKIPTPDGGKPGIGPLVTVSVALQGPTVVLGIGHDSLGEKGIK